MSKYYGLTWLQFQPTDMPFWRNSSTPTTSVMMRQIGEMSAQHAAASGHAVTGPLVRSATESAVRMLVVEWVLKSNQLELVGLQDLGDTLACIEAGAADSPSLKQRETVSTFRALQFLHEHFQETEHSNRADATEHPYQASHSVFLTEDLVKELHRNLAQGIMQRESIGAYRTTVLATRLSSSPDGWYTYTAPTLIPSTATSIIDQHNGFLDKMGNDASLAQYVNLAAWLFLQIITLHPFTDGNGRTARMLASFTLKPVCPFPVSMMPITISGMHSPHDSYIAAIAASRGEGGYLHQPQLLSALIIENVWQQWRFITASYAQLVPEDGVLYRGELFASTFDERRYANLVDIQLTAEEQKKELQDISCAITTARSLPGRIVIVQLCHDTFCKLIV